MMSPNVSAGFRICKSAPRLMAALLSSNVEVDDQCRIDAPSHYCMLTLSRTGRRVWVHLAPLVAGSLLSGWKAEERHAISSGSYLKRMEGACVLVGGPAAVVILI